ncbi:MAG: DUF5312 domain-containing protein [Spirochaetes bacterium]|nr:DUF5312 domain-containing protein [Spirochaetota bacterium]
MKRTVFDEMAVSISEKERRDLLKKINRNMNLNDPRFEEAIYHVDLPKEEKDKYIKEEIAKLGFFERLILKIKKFFSGKTEEATYNDLKFAALRKSISKKSPGITNFDARTISRLFAEIVYPMALKTSSLVHLFEEFWRQGDTFQKILTQLVESRLPGVVRTIDDLLSDEDAESIVFEKETKTAIKDEVILRFNSYAKKVSDSVFHEIEEEILPLYYFRPVIVFPYYDFFKLFGFNPYSAASSLKGSSGNSSFSLKSSPSFSCIVDIERLYYAIYMVLKVSRPIKIDPLLGEHFCRNIKEENIEPKNSREIGAQDTPDNRELDYEYLDEDIIKNSFDNSGSKSDDNESAENKRKWFCDKLDEIYDESKRIDKKIALVELIKYYRNDYYYKLAFYVPKLRLKELYFASLKIQILEQINEKYARARNSMIERNIDRLFRGKTFMKFLHFRTYIGFDHEKIGVAYFANIRSMELLYNYLVYYYNDRIRQILDFSTKTILAQDKITSTNVMMQVSTIDDAFVKIQDFDKALSPDAEDGKLFLRLRHGLLSDVAYLKMYKGFLLQKNKTSKDIINRSLEAFENIMRTFSELLNSSLFEIKNSLAVSYNIDGKTRSFREFLVEAVENIRYFKTLLTQIMKTEEKG